MRCKGHSQIPVSAFTTRPSVDLQVSARFVLNDLTETAAALHSYQQWFATSNRYGAMGRAGTHPYRC